MTMPLTNRQLDNLDEVQFNLDPAELEAAIDALSQAELVELREQAIALIDRQTDLVRKVEARLRQKAST